MRVGVVGSRQLNVKDIIYATLDLVFKDINPSECIIVTGGCKGPDSIALEYASDKQMKTVLHLPDWSRYGRAAGPIRNELIVQGSDLIVAFWDGKSKGTLSSINIAKRLDKPVIIIDCN